MVQVKSSTSYKKPSLFDNVQYVISIVLTICLGMSLIPGYFGKVSGVIIAGLVIQLIFSGLRIKLINVFLELIVLLLSLVGFIPYLGWIPRFFAFFISLLDMASLNNNSVSKQIEIRAFRGKSGEGGGFSWGTAKKKSVKKSKKVADEDVVDVDYEEK